MNRVTITGHEAEVWLVYPAPLAAKLGSWSLTAEPAGGTLIAKVVSHDAFKVSQQPLTFVVPRPSGHQWRWPIKSLQMSAHTLTAEVGPPEE